MISNEEIADRLTHIGQLYRLKENFLQSRAFLSAAKVVEDLPVFLEKTKFNEHDDVDRQINAVIRELLTTGESRLLKELEAELPNAGLDLSWIPGVGPLEASRLARKYRIQTMVELLAVLEPIRRKEPEFYRRVLDGMERRELKRVERKRLRPLAVEILSALRACPHVLEAELAGSWRRGRRTVKDLDIVIGVDRPEAVRSVKRVAKKLGRIIWSSDSRIRIRCRIEDLSINVDLLLADVDRYGASLLYYTGSKEFNRRMRSVAKVIGLKLTEYGVYRDELWLGGRTEREVFEILGLDYVRPEERII